MLTRLRVVWGRSLLADRSLLLLLAGILVTFLGLGIIIPARVLYARDIGLSLFEIGAMASGFLLTNTVGQAPAGWLADRLGRKPMIVGGMAAQAVIAIIYVIVDAPWTFIALRALEGVGAAATMPAARAYVGDIAPPARRGEAYGWLGAALNGGLLFGPALGGWLAGLVSYEAAFIASAAGRLVAVVIVALLVPESAAHAARSASRRSAPTDWRRALTPLLIGGYCIAFGLGYASGIFFALWSLWLEDLGASLTIIGLTYTAFSLPSLALTPVAGWLADRVGRLPLIIGPGLADAALYLGYGLTTNVGLILALCAFQGVIYAFILPALDAYIADASPEEGRGGVQGLYNGASLFGSFLSAMLCTVLYGWQPLAPFIMLTIVVTVTISLGGLLVARARRLPAPVAAGDG